ncbi:MAG: phosphotransferase [Bacteroidales bacterium]|nr:phosphotransferase [Bacteroidales bacterium]
MAHYSRLSRKDIEAISADFGLHSISSFKVLSGGWENTNYLVEAGKGRYVLTLCEQKKPEQARDLVFLLEHLERNHFGTSRVKRSLKNEPLILRGGESHHHEEFCGRKDSERVDTSSD